MHELPETVLQFGGGNFLRAFADVFIDEANKQGQNVGRIVVVQSTASSRADALNTQQGKYHVITRGLQNGQRIDKIQEINSISRALNANTQWADVLAVGTSADLKYIISNTTEAGFALDAADTPQSAPPKSFPAKLLKILEARFNKGLPGVIILPCELIDENGDKLLALVREQATAWRMPVTLINWLGENNVWLNNLVDRIVSGKPAEHPLLASDALLTVAEPYACWVIQDDTRAPLFKHPAIIRAKSVLPYSLRKVRILNGSHTSLVSKALPMGIATVREAIEHPVVGPWLKKLLNEEIIPTIQDRVDDPQGFAAATLERFGNPFLEHKLASIALNHQAKMRTRIMTTRDEYVAKFGKRPALLDEAIAAGEAIK